MFRQKNYPSSSVETELFDQFAEAPREITTGMPMAYETYRHCEDIDWTIKQALTNTIIQEEPEKREETVYHKQTGLRTSWKPILADNINTKV